MRKLSILAVSFMFSIAAASASSITINYTLTAGDDVITFSLPQPPTVIDCTFEGSCFGTAPTDLVVNGALILDGTVNFYTPDEIGGLTILEGTNLLVNNGGVQLFSGTLENPTLHRYDNLPLSAYDFGSPFFNEAFTLNATAPVPEPAAGSLMLAGAGVCALISRKRARARQASSL